MFGSAVSLPQDTGYRSVFNRVTTFWTFLEQVLGDGSCRDTTRLVQARRDALGRPSISSANVAYCKARARASAAPRSRGVTTILDAPAQAIAELYLRRWQIEVCFRDIKTTLGMELLRGKSPAIVEREAAMHLLAYNLLRTLMLQAAQQENQPFYAMSFTGARQATQRFASIIANTSSKNKQQRALKELLRCIGTDPVLRRPNRSEPRVLKRRPKSYQRLNKIRQKMKVSPSKRLK